MVWDNRHFISIHALLAESDCFFCVKLLLQLIFLSTLSLRRATAKKYSGLSFARISIHALLAESDLSLLIFGCWMALFLSTLSLRRATWNSFRYFGCNCYFYPRSPCGERPWQRGSRITYVEFLSTLSLRRATMGCIPLLPLFLHFYPRSPCGERP